MKEKKEEEDVEAIREKVNLRLSQKGGNGGLASRISKDWQA